MKRLFFLHGSLQFIFSDQTRENEPTRRGFHLIYQHFTRSDYSRNASTKCMHIARSSPFRSNEKRPEIQAEGRRI
jgi:hypothetical protein